jgi:hypothetical protein
MAAFRRNRWPLCLGFRIDRHGEQHGEESLKPKIHVLLGRQDRNGNNWLLMYQRFRQFAQHWGDPNELARKARQDVFQETPVGKRLLGKTWGKNE